MEQSIEDRDNSTRNARPQQQTKNKLNIVCRGFVKENKIGGEIISVVPDIPIAAYLDDLLFIITIPNEGQDYAPAYIRLQDKDGFGATSGKDEIQHFTEVHSIGFVKQKKGEIIVCAPSTHVWVELNKIVFIATIPSDGKDRAPCYIKPRNFRFDPRPKVELKPIEDDGKDFNIDDDEPEERSFNS